MAVNVRVTSGILIGPLLGQIQAQNSAGVGSITTKMAASNVNYGQ